MQPTLTAEQALARAAGWLDGPPARIDRVPRRVIGLVGAPGVGKSTFGAALTAAVARSAGTRPAGSRPTAAAPPVALLPMDGFHLAQSELARRGLGQRKGAPETFDADGFVAAVARVRDGRSTYVPRFDRTVEEPIAGAVLVDGATPVVVVEGNYLLLPDEPWAHLGALLDEVWFLAVDDDVRRARLRARHVSFGRTRSDAESWIATVDDPNAALIASTRARADLVVDLDGWEPSAAPGGDGA